MFDYQPEDKAPQNNKSQFDQDLNRGLALLVIIAVSIVGSSWLFLLPVYFNIKIAAQLFPLLLASMLLFLVSRVQNKYLNKGAAVIAYLFSFFSWSYVLYLNFTLVIDDLSHSAAQLSGVANSMYLLGLCFLVLWSGRYIKYSKYFSLVSIVCLILWLFIFTPASVSFLIAIILLLGSSAAMSVIGFNPIAINSVSTENIPELFNNDFLLPSEHGVEEITPELEINSLPLNESSVTHDWELILRELNSELKNTADVDQLFKRMLVFLHGAMEYNAAAVGMRQDRNIKKIATYGEDELLRTKSLSWTNQRIKEVFSSREPVLSRQAHLSASTTDVTEPLHRLDVPVLSGQKVVGLVSLFRENLIFDSHDVKLVASIVFHSMVALREARLQDEIKRLSSVSTPTKLTLYSREQFVTKVKPVFNKLNKPRECSLFIVEIDNIDTVIDSKGRDAGILLYKAVSKTIMSELRNNDVFGRYGNDGFIILLDETDMNHAKAVAEKVRSKVSKIKLTYKDLVITTTVSIGLTIVSDQEEDLPSLMRKADMGLFIAKENGCNTIKVSL